MKIYGKSPIEILMGNDKSALYNSTTLAIMVGLQYHPQQAEILKCKEVSINLLVKNW